MLASFTRCARAGTRLGVLPLLQLLLLAPGGSSSVPDFHGGKYTTYAKYAKQDVGVRPHHMTSAAGDGVAHPLVNNTIDATARPDAMTAREVQPRHDLNPRHP